MSNETGYYYTVANGDSLSRIAKKCGLGSWKIIWDHPKNAAFRKSHPGPNTIFVGEQLWIPAAPLTVVLNSGTTNTVAVQPIRVKSISFQNDFDVLHRNDSTWTKTGPLITEPKWDRTHSDAVVCKIDSVTKPNVVFEVQGITATEGDICGEGGARFLRYEGKGTFKKGDVTMTLNADASIPNFIEKLADIKFNWGITTDKGLVSAGTTLHTFYHVLGKPIDNGLPEDGATTRRMDTATDWILKTGCKEPVDIVKALFGKFPGYILGFSMLSDELKNEIKSDLLLKKALLDAGFADYRKDNLGGAWPLAEFQKFGGECQAIVRLIRGIIHQVGCPGTIELKFVNADAPNYLEGIIKSVGTTCSGPDPKKGYSLVDGKVQVGNTYDGNDGVGFNNYEAYMKYSYVNSSGKSRVAWFGGGLGLLDDVAATDSPAVKNLEKRLIRVFWGLVEFEKVYVSGKMKCKITNIWKY